MLSISLFRQSPDLILEGLRKKHFPEPELVSRIAEGDASRRQIQVEAEAAAAFINSASKQIGALMQQGQRAEAEALKAEVARHKNNEKELQQKLTDADATIQEMLIRLPNLPHSSVPEGKTPEDNEVVREGGKKPDLSAQKLPHWELTAKYRLIDFELGTKITGSGFPVYMGQGARLQRALITAFLDYNLQAGYQEYYPPYMVNEASAFGTTQLPDKEGQMYYAAADDYYLIPTAEVPLTNLYRDTITPEAQLPVKMTGYTPCFRREAGSYGKDVRGLNRVHQFDKVEVVQLVPPDRSYEVLDEMVAHVEALLHKLELPYRILRLCGGDMSFSSALTYDFEVWSAAQERWLEVSSVSNFESFQTNRLKARYRNAEGKTQILHSLNGSSLALPRIVACLLENNQTQEGIRLPEFLKPYFGAEMIS
ncbi:MAG: serine--tRNA ligase [Bacteroidetes bacterium]|nr:serine--tRNA ligase [Bacteroidota bacterium]MBS1630195.1 serine--tRNA ligase [Bacteroidota bacterium]